MAESKPTFIKRILLGVSAIKKLLSDHNTDTAAHPNGFNHNITITTKTEPTITLKQTSNAIGSGSSTTGTIGFTDKNDKWICFVDAECATDRNALEIHINNVGSPAEYYNVPAVCSFNRNNDNTCSINLCNNRIDNVCILNCTDHIVIRKELEPALWLVSTSQANGVESIGGGAILFKDKSSICLSALDIDTHNTENQFNFHLASPTSTDTSTTIPSVMRLVHDKNGVKYLDLLNNSIKRAKVSTPTSSDDKWTIVNKEYVDTAISPINLSLSSKSEKNHTHSASDITNLTRGIGFPDWSRKQDRSLKTTYTASDPGWILYDSINDGSKARDAKLYINDIEILRDYHNADNDDSMFFVPIDTGDTYRITDNGSFRRYWFVPFK